MPDSAGVDPDPANKTPLTPNLWRGLMKNVFVVGLLLTLPSVVTAQNADWTERVEPFAIAEGLYYVGPVGLSAYLLTSADGHILIDAPLRENVPLILENIRSLGFDPADVRIQLASHAHYDHVGGLADMLAATGAELVLSEGDAPFVRSGDDFGLDTQGYSAAAPVRTIGHLEKIRIGDREITAHLTPGHTPGCTSWSGTVEIGGEEFRFVSVCSLTVLSTYRIVGDGATYAGQGADFCRSVAHLRTLDPDIFLGAHGAFFGLAEKLAALRAGNEAAFVERQRFTRYLDGAEANIERALLAQGHEGGCDSLIQ